MGGGGAGRGREGGDVRVCVPPRAWRRIAGSILGGLYALWGPILGRLPLAACTGNWGDYWAAYLAGWLHAWRSARPAAGGSRV